LLAGLDTGYRQVSYQPTYGAASLDARLPNARAGGPCCVWENPSRY